LLITREKNRAETERGSAEFCEAVPSKLGHPSAVMPAQALSVSLECSEKKWHPMIKEVAFMK
jgi:hypothetical protein